MHPLWPSVIGAVGIVGVRTTQTSARRGARLTCWRAQCRKRQWGLCSARFYTSPTNEGEGGGAGTSQSKSSGDSLGAKMREAAATSFASVAMLAVGFGLAGYGYHRYYKHLVLRKMALAFEPGDPVLELAAMGAGEEDDAWYGARSDANDDAAHNYWIERPEQGKVDAIVGGREVGHYHLFIGEKGTGKSSMQLEAMARIDGEGVSMFDAHADLEIFRIRLGKALNYEFHEDYIGGYFSERGPRESTALLDIERALNKLEKVALQRRRRSTSTASRYRPLVLIINQMHLVRDDDDGRDLIELLQQRAEQWAAAKLVTVVFNSDDYWVYERLKKLGARLEVHSIQDLARRPAMATLQRFRQRFCGERVSDPDAALVYDLVGGRPTFLSRVARSPDMFATCRTIIAAEKTWFLNQCWILGAEMDDDVMDQQKWAAAAMTLALSLVDKEAEATTADASAPDPYASHDLPSFALHEAQQIMTRADFVREMDRNNLFAITSDAQVRASSVPMHEALRQICSIPGFREHLDATVQRISDIESLGRTRELVAKDLVLGGHYELSPKHRSSPSSLFGRSDPGKTSEVRFRGWSPHERPARDPPESEDKQ